MLVMKCETAKSLDANKIYKIKLSLIQVLVASKSHFHIEDLNLNSRRVKKRNPTDPTYII